MIPYKKVCRQLCGPAFSNEESYTHIENVFIIFFTVAWPGVQAAIGQGFYLLLYCGLWRMHQLRISYFSSSNLKKRFGYQRYKRISPICKVSDKLVYHCEQ